METLVLYMVIMIQLTMIKLTLNRINIKNLNSYLYCKFPKYSGRYGNIQYICERIVPA